MITSRKAWCLIKTFLRVIHTHIYFRNWMETPEAYSFNIHREPKHTKSVRKVSDLLHIFILNRHGWRWVVNHYRTLTSSDKGLKAMFPRNGLQQWCILPLLLPYLYSEIIFTKALDNTCIRTLLIQNLWFFKKPTLNTQQYRCISIIFQELVCNNKW